MREIKFRAWLKETKEMIPVYQIDFNNGIINSESAWRMESEYILEQFTGLHDKNGVEIFEGDVVKHNNTHYTVEFSRTQLGFVCMDRKHKTRGGWPNWRDGQWMQNVSKYLEVIGNIHDNPELLEVRK